MKVWLIRHGTTIQGEERRYQGVLDTSLSEKGRSALRQAEHTPQKVYTSALKRTVETAEILFPGVPIITVQNLSEMNFGSFEGRGWWEMENDPTYRTWVDGGCEGRCPGGEDRMEFSERVCDAFRSIVRAEKGSGELVIVAHGGTQMALLERFGEPQRAYYKWQRPCGCGWLLDWDTETERLRVLQEIGYLK